MNIAKHFLQYLIGVFIFLAITNIFISCSGNSEVSDTPVASETTNLDRDGDNILNTDEDKNNNGVVDSGETDPDGADTDNDGKNDYDEILVGDSDGDGLSDAVESMYFDEDGDGIVDEDDSDSDGPCTGQKVLSAGQYTETLTLASDCSPYLVTGKVIISNTSMIIEEGVEIRFRRQGSLQIGDSEGPGILQINGTITNQVSLISDELTKNEGDWQGILVANGGDLSFDYAEVKHAGLSVADTVQGGLVITKSTNISIEDSLFSDNLGYGLYINIDESNNPPLTLVSEFSGNSFDNNDYSLGISLKRLSEFSLADSSFSFGPIELLGDELSNSVSLYNRGVPYFFEDNLSITGSLAQPTSFTVLAGTTMRFASGKGIIVASSNANLSISGTSGSPVIVGSRPDSLESWGGIEFQYGASSISETWFFNMGGFEAEPGINSSFIVRNDAALTFSGSEVVVDGSGYTMYQESTNCNTVSVLPALVNIVGYQDCQVYCNDLSTDTGNCLQQ